MKTSKTMKIALGGICLALTVIFLFGGSIVPGIELTLFAISSLFTAVMILETGVKGGVLLYAGAVLLGFAIIPNKLAMIPYAFFFGYYGIVKYYIEKLPGRWIQLALKTGLFAVLLSIGLIGFKKLLLGSIHLPDYPVWLLILAGIAFLLLYDFVYTFLIGFYLRRIKGRGIDGIRQDGTIDADVKQKVQDETKKYFRPELLNRIDEIVVFSPLTEDQIVKIIDLGMKDIEHRLEERNIKLSLTEAAKKFIADESYDPAYGARPVKRFLQRSVETELAGEIIRGTVKDGDSVIIDSDGSKLSFQTR